MSKQINKDSSSKGEETRIEKKGPASNVKSSNPLNKGGVFNPTKGEMK